MRAMEIELVSLRSGVHLWVLGERGGACKECEVFYACVCVRVLDHVELFKSDDARVQV
jgi:hypothetical protein